MEKEYMVVPCVCTDCFFCQEGDCVRRGWERIDPDMQVMQADCGTFAPQVPYCYQVEASLPEEDNQKRIIGYLKGNGPIDASQVLDMIESGALPAPYRQAKSLFLTPLKAI